MNNQENNVRPGENHPDPGRIIDEIVDRLSKTGRKTVLDLAANLLEFEEAQRAANQGTLVEPGASPLPPGHDEALAWVEAWLRDGQQGVPTGQEEQFFWACAHLTEEEFAVRRKAALEKSTVPADYLDRAVKKRRPVPEQKPLDISQIVEDTEPCAEPVDGAMLFRDLVAFFLRFISFKQATDAAVCAVWAIGTHSMDEFDIFPRMHITAITKDCGKTTLLRVEQDLVARPLSCDDLTPAFTFHAIDNERPTMVIDELDSFINKDRELVGILNSGHKRGGYVGRIVDEGERKVAKRYLTFAPVVYGMIGGPPATLASRSLVIQLLKKKPSENLEDYNKTDSPELVEQATQLRRRIVRWALDHKGALRASRPDTKTLSNRARDNWRPMLKIAANISQECLQEIYAAAGVEVAGPGDEDQVTLLRDVRNIFHTRKVDKLPSFVLVADLGCQTQSPWPTFRNNRDPMNEHNLATMLKRDFGIDSERLSLLKGECLKLFPNESYLKVRKPRGYKLASFEKYIASHLSGEDASEVEVSPFEL